MTVFDVPSGLPAAVPTPLVGDPRLARLSLNQATTKRWLARRLDLLEDGEYVGPSPPAPRPKPSASEASA